MLYSSYAEYLENRKSDIQKMAKKINLDKDMLKPINESLTNSIKHVKVYDNLKHQIEETVGHELEYAEIDIYVQLISSCVIMKKFDDKDFDSSTDSILKEIDNIYPGIYSEELVKSINTIAENFTNAVTK